jgi:GNAT superfamily N-acetyltransferase
LCRGGLVKIRRLTPENLADVYCCVGDRKKLFETEISEALTHLRGKLEHGWLAYAIYGGGKTPIGMAILVPPSDPLSPIAGEGVYYLHCMDINKEFRKQGIGAEVAQKLSDDVKALGGKGLAVDCYGDYWMPCAFFRKQGFEEVRDYSFHSLLLKKINEDAEAEYVETSYRGDLPESGIQVDIQHPVTCPFMIHNFRSAKNIVRRLEPKAELRERTISTKEDVEGWGGAGLYVNGRLVSAGPVDEERLRKAFEEAKQREVR